MNNHNLLLIGLLFALFFSSCKKKPLCEEENYGTVTIINNTGRSYEFDVAYDQNSENNWYDNDVESLVDSASYLWEKVGADSITIWIKSALEGWKIIDTRILNACENLEISYDNLCVFEKSGALTINNDCGFGYDFRILLNGQIHTERWIENNKSSTWKVLEPGTATIEYSDFWTDWTTLASVDIIECEHTTYTVEPPYDPCEDDRTGKATIINRSGFSIVVNITMEATELFEERTLKNGQSVTYTVSAEEPLKFIAKPINGSWSVSQEYTVDVCGELTYYWTSIEAEKKNTTKLLIGNTREN